jgi:hypothetical protein
MGKKVKNSRQTAERKKPSSSQAPTGKKGKSRKVRPHSITLADLFLWITVVDEALVHPTKAFKRAAESEGIKSVGNVQNRLKVLEDRFGKLFEGSRPRRYRYGVPTPRGAALAELFVLIEQLWKRAISLKGPGRVADLKDSLLPYFPKESWRPADQIGTSRISGSLVWRGRLMQNPKTGKAKNLYDWPLRRPRVSPRSSPNS